IGERKLSDIEQGGEVRVPRKDVSEPSFGFGRGGDRERVFPGNREYTKGDRIPRGGESGGGGNRQAQTEALKRSLIEGLSLEKSQIEELDRIFAQSGAEMRALVVGGASPEERRAKFRQIREAAAKRIEAMLNDEQKRKYAEMRAAQAGGTPGELHVVGSDGQPKTVRVRVGVTDGTTSEVITRELKPGDEVIVGGGPRNAPASDAAPRLRF
ncbi:MAG: DUF444 family protein, partial [Alphaproteobacteria bacterium]|nr:DUF444 family protein [Alphaproteobacteria bacterium]